MNTKLSVAIRELQAALLFSSSNENKYVLNGVHIESKAGKLPLLVATDGARLAVIETEAEQKSETGDASFILEKGFVKRLCGFAKSKALSVEIEFHGSTRALFHIEDCVIDQEKGALIEGDFPKWRQVLPSGDKIPLSEIGFNASLLADFHKTGKTMGCVGVELRLNMFSAEGVTEVHIGGKPNFYGVIMPLKPTTATEWQPHFLNHL